MSKVRAVTDPYLCERLWKTYIPAGSISDLWDFRICFQKYFKNSFRFLVAEDRNKIAGVLPLSIIDDLDINAFFPAETWNNRTWLERTPIFAGSRNVLYELLSSCSERTYLRYIDAGWGYTPAQLDTDEIGYVIYPRLLDYDRENYRRRFSSKKFKSILKTVNSILDMGGCFDINHTEDFDLLVEMSIEKYGDESYLQDTRFRNSFRDVIGFLKNKGYLRMVSLKIDGKTVAVDIGALYNGVYTVFLGGVFSSIPGLAKVMNMHHIDFALNSRIHKLDFLCGDFNWKKLWHLDQEPLFKLVSTDLEDTLPSYQDNNLHHSVMEEMEVY